MPTRRRARGAFTLSALSILGLVLAACGDPPEPASSGVGAGAGATANGPIEVDEDTLRSWIDAMVELREHGMEASQKIAADPGALNGYFSGMQISREWQEILDRHGFSMAAFQDASGQITGALAAVMMEEQESALAEQRRAADEAMRGLPGVTEEQLAEMRKSMGQWQDSVEALAGSASEETKALIRRYRAQIEQRLR